MGLDVSHGAFSASYGAFNRFRKAVAKAWGGSYPPHDDESLDDSRWYCGEGTRLEDCPGLVEFFNHSDCDGEISPETCRRVADDLERLLPGIDAAGIGAGHIERDGGYGVVARQFIAGCRAAADAGEPLVFE